MTSREWQKAISLLRVHHLAQVSIVILVVVVLLALTAPVLPLPNPRDQDLGNVLLPPIWERGGTPAHPFGTDFLGRDMLSRVVWGSQISLLVGFSATALAALIGVSVGLAASYRGGLVDEVTMRIFDTILSIPGILIAIAVLTVLGQSLLLLIVVLGFRSTVSYARTLRSRVLSVKEEQYVKAARAVGVREPVIMIRHVLPNCLAPIIVLTTIYIGVMILIEAGLSFLGLTRLHVSWGVMVAESRDYLATAWWTATFPGLFIFLTVLSINILGDFFRDVFDPRLQVRTGV
jgi:peptide/nickel transport system permease protein